LQKPLWRRRVEPSEAAKLQPDSQKLSWRLWADPFARHAGMSCGTDLGVGYLAKVEIEG
jgi:hypothetical protein